ncbi:hypothetical protein FGRMN_1846 [Fusarium graminum]|nr:hypothetical protein FGRMN_1846 [Fusarium graminum]
MCSFVSLPDGYGGYNRVPTRDCGRTSCRNSRNFIGGGIAGAQSGYSGHWSAAAPSSSGRGYSGSTVGSTRPSGTYTSTGRVTPASAAAARTSTPTTPQRATRLGVFERMSRRISSAFSRSSDDSDDAPARPATTTPTTSRRDPPERSSSGSERPRNTPSFARQSRMRVPGRRNLAASSSASTASQSSTNTPRRGTTASTTRGSASPSPSRRRQHRTTPLRRWPRPQSSTESVSSSSNNRQSSSRSTWDGSSSG